LFQWNFEEGRSPMKGKTDPMPAWKGDVVMLKT
jgi:hypothetical protein